MNVAIRVRGLARPRSVRSARGSTRGLLCHFRARLIAAATSPGAWALLAVGGLLSMPLLWSILLIEGLLNYPFLWRPAVLSVFLWAPLVALAVSGARLVRHSPGPAGGRALPALPIGPRSRAVAEALVAVALVLVACTLGFFVAPGEPPRFGAGGADRSSTILSFSLSASARSGADIEATVRPFVPPNGPSETDRVIMMKLRLLPGARWATGLDAPGPPTLLGRLLASPGGAFVGTCLLSVLFILPLLLAWTAVASLDWRGLLVPGLVMCALYAEMKSGAAATLLPAAVTSLTLSGLVLTLVGVVVHVDEHAAARRRPGVWFRVSPGPAAQLWRDGWSGPVARLGPFVATMLVVLLLALALGGPRGAGLAFLALLALTSVLLHPFGLRLVSAAAPGDDTFWNGSFGRAWSVLPVRGRDVLRAVYAHGWIAGTALWLLLCGWVWSVAGFGGRAGVVTVAFEFAGIPLAAAVLVCAAVGDSRRGSLALGALLAFQLLVPVGPVVARDLGMGFFSAPEHRAVVMLTAAYGLAAVGGLPPLVHLRGRRRKRVRPAAA